MKRQILRIFARDPIETLIGIGIKKSCISVIENHATYRNFQKAKFIKISLLNGDWYHADGVLGGDLFDLFALLHDLPKTTDRNILINEAALALGLEIKHD